MDFRGLVGKRVVLCENTARFPEGIVAVRGIFFDAPVPKRWYEYGVFTTFDRPVGDNIAYLAVDSGAHLSVVGRDPILWVPEIRRYGSIAPPHPFYSRLRRIFENTRWS